MKKIYTITLDDEIPLSDSISSDIKEIAYFLFEEIDKYDLPILIVDDEKNTLVRNELLESFDGIRYNYRFESENSKIENYRFEPFLINNRSFAFTVYDGSVTDEDVMSFLNTVQKMLGLNYKFNIDTVYYEDEYVNGRLSAYNFLTNGVANLVNNEERAKVKKKTKLLAKPLLSMLNF